MPTWNATKVQSLKLQACKICMLLGCEDFTVRDSIELSWELPGTAVSPAEFIPRQRWTKWSTDWDSAESSREQPGTAVSPAEFIPRQHWVKRSTVRDSAETSLITA